MKSLFFLLITWGIPAFTYAHPHVFMEQSLALEMEGSLVKGVWVEWSFDEMMTSAVSLDFPPNTQGRWSESVLKKVKESYFDSLKSVGYFIHLYFNNTPITMENPMDFQAYISAGKLIYRFFVKINKLGLPGSSLTVGIYDDTFYCDIRFRGENSLEILSKDPGAKKVVFNLVPNSKRKYWNDTITPVEAIFQFK